MKSFQFKRTQHKYKGQYKIGNWAAYEGGLRQRGSVTVWLGEDVRKAVVRVSDRDPGRDTYRSSDERHDLSKWCAVKQPLDKDGISDDIHLFNKKLREWEDYYNYHRPHGGLDGHTPYERLLQKTRAAVSPAS